jgi:outer membrane immunogenic protein
VKRIFLITAAVSALLASPALAGDLSAPPPEAPMGSIVATAPAAPPAPPPIVKAAPLPTMNWTGSFVYGFGAYGNGDVSGDDNRFTFLNRSLRPSTDGFLGGVGTGFNYQYNQWVFGVLGDIGGGQINGNRTDSGTLSATQANGFFGVPKGTFGGPASVSARLESSMNWMSTVRGRIGWSWYDSPYMFYGTAGVAFGDMKLRASATGNDGITSPQSFLLVESKTLVGYAVGAGFEAMLDRNFSAGVEYLYTSLPKETYFAGTLANPISAGMDIHQVRATLGYHF